MAVRSLYVSPDQQWTKTIEGVPGMFPRMVIVYRLALSKERHAVKSKAGDVAAIDAAETEVISKYVVTINDQPLGSKDKISRLHPEIRVLCLELCLGYRGSDEVADDG